MVSRSISKFPKKYETTATKLAELIASDPNNARVQLLAGLTRLSPEAKDVERKKLMKWMKSVEELKKKDSWQLDAQAKTKLANEESKLEELEALELTMEESFRGSQLQRDIDALVGPRESLQTMIYDMLTDAFSTPESSSDDNTSGGETPATCVSQTLSEGLLEKKPKERVVGHDERKKFF